MTTYCSEDNKEKCWSCSATHFYGIKGWKKKINLETINNNYKIKLNEVYKNYKIKLDKYNKINNDNKNINIIDDKIFKSKLDKINIKYGNKLDKLFIKYNMCSK